MNIRLAEYGREKLSETCQTELFCVTARNGSFKAFGKRLEGCMHEGKCDL
jgi:hypothetical protein